MEALLIHLDKLLTEAPALTDLGYTDDRIGQSVRRNTEFPCIEYAVTGQGDRGQGQSTIILEVRIYSSTGASECWKTDTAIQSIVTPTNLSSNDLDFKVSRVRRIDANSRNDENTEWRSRLIRQYLLHYVELNPVQQT